MAQAISETLPIESREKKLLDGFLAGRERILDKMKDESERRTEAGPVCFRFSIVQGIKEVSAVDKHGCAGYTRRSD